MWPNSGYQIDFDEKLLLQSFNDLLPVATEWMMQQFNKWYDTFSDGKAVNVGTGGKKLNPRTEINFNI